VQLKARALYSSGNVKRELTLLFIEDIAKLDEGTKYIVSETEDLDLKVTSWPSACLERTPSTAFTKTRCGAGRVRLRGNPVFSGCELICGVRFCSSNHSSRICNLSPFLAEVSRVAISYLFS
jgi:hypothetical protein